jgi:hypothetical protein
VKSLLFKIGITTFCTEANSPKLVEQGRRIELLALAWKAKVLPLYEPCVELLIIQQSGTVVKIFWFPVKVSILGLPVISRVLYL